MAALSLVGALNDALISVISEYGWVAVLVTMTLESALIPIPSEVVMPYAGYVSWLRGLGMTGVLFYSMIGVIGNLLGSLIAYYAGAHGGRPLIIRYGKYLLISRREFERAERMFERYGWLAVLLGRVTPAVRTVISLPAGMFRMPLERFTLYTLIGSIPWNLALTMIGFKLGPSWYVIEEYFTYLDVIVVVGVVVLVAYVILRLRQAPS